MCSRSKPEAPEMTEDLLAADLLSALVILHQSAVIHGALHPNNVLLTAVGGLYSLTMT
jgi:serine/threonine protein kinase